MKNLSYFHHMLKNSNTKKGVLCEESTIILLYLDYIVLFNQHIEVLNGSCIEILKKNKNYFYNVLSNMVDMLLQYIYLFEYVEDIRDVEENLVDNLYGRLPQFKKEIFNTSIC